MRLCRFNDDRLGLVEQDQVIDVTAALEALPDVRWPLPPGDLLIAHLAAVQERVIQLKEGAAVAGAGGAAEPGRQPEQDHRRAGQLPQAPRGRRADPGLHFGADIRTIDHYGLFLKSSTSLDGASEGVALPALERRMDHEVELAAVIGREAFRVRREEALGHVAGYAVGLDMSIRGTEDRSWRKSFDSATVLGPWLVTADELGDPGALDLTLEVNGEVRQASSTRYLIFDVARLIEYASSTYRLYPGDVILTGTPEGVGPVGQGDVMRAAVERVGAMTVRVRSI